MNNEVIGDKNAICLYFHPYLLNICKKIEFLISQGSVATCLRWDGQCRIGFSKQISYTFQRCKTFENRLRFDKVAESSKVRTFLRLSGYNRFTKSLIDLIAYIYFALAPVTLPCIKSNKMELNWKLDLFGCVILVESNTNKLIWFWSGSITTDWNKRNPTDVTIKRMPAIKLQK